MEEGRGEAGGKGVVGGGGGGGRLRSLSVVVAETLKITAVSAAVVVYYRIKLS